MDQIILTQMAERLVPGELVVVRMYNAPRTRLMFDGPVQIKYAVVEEGDVILHAVCIREYEAVMFRLGQCVIVPLVDGRACEDMAWSAETYGATALEDPGTVDWDAALSGIQNL